MERQGNGHSARRRGEKPQYNLVAETQNGNSDKESKKKKHEMHLTLGHGRNRN